MRVLPFVSLILSLIVTIAGCAAPTATPTTGGRLAVVATFYPLEFLASRAGGELVTVQGLVRPGVEPHDWEPTPGDIVAIRQARVFVYHGAGMEAWAERVVRDLPQNGPWVVEAAAGLEVDQRDPHLWLDPLLFAREGAAIEAALVQADPAGRQAYVKNVAKLQLDLQALHDEMDRGLRDCARRTFVTSHAAFHYLAVRYKLDQVAIAGISPEEEPSPARMRLLVDEVKRLGVTHIFFETLVSPAASETLAKEAGVATLVLDPIEGITREQQEAGADYFSLMRQNLANLRLALGCR